MHTKGEISKIIFTCVEMKKSEIRLKFENLHPCNNQHGFNKEPRRSIWAVGRLHMYIITCAGHFMWLALYAQV